MVFDHMENNLKNDFESVNQGRSQTQQENNNAIMLWTFCGLLFIFVCYGFYLLFK